MPSARCGHTDALDAQSDVSRTSRDNARASLGIKPPAMRTLPVLLLLAACSKDSKSNLDASIQIIDSKPPDAPVDAPPDAPPDAPVPMNIVTACDHACTAVGACVMMTPPPSCYSECATDLLDCSAQQIAAIDACSSEMCGDIENQMSPLVDCLDAVTCISAMLTSPVE